MPLAAGTRLGPYEIVAPLGVGGMGEVYTARDTRLDRTVAVKVLPPDLTANPERRARFEREARAVAALQHPNICTIHDVGVATQGVPFLVMELLSGETLQRRLERGPLDDGEFVEIAGALTAAIDAAHASGIIHRDLKPTNIFLTGHGPKILDFGLAKALVHQPVAGESMQSTKLADRGLTEQGQVIGTVAYMSPEQLRGEDVDARTDLFSLGLVLYEMATGRRAFSGTTSAMISAAILHEQPSGPRQIRPALSARLEDIILKALEKDRRLRYQHASEMHADLRRATRDSESTSSAPVQRPPAARTMRRALLLAAAGVALAASVLAGYMYLHRPAKLTDKDTLVLADFANTTGDPVFDETLRQGLAVQLAESPFLSIVSEERIRNALQLMGQSAGTRLTGDIARDLCVRTGSTAVVTGSIASLGTQYVLGLRAENCGTGELLGQEQLPAARKEDVLNVLSQLATKFRTRVGESLATVEQHSTPLEEATTPSLDALKAYSIASARPIDPQAVTLFKRAVDIDPNFAVAHARLGLAYSGLGESLLGEQSTSRAYELRDHASDRERFFITTIYDRQVTGNLEREADTLRLWAQTYPRDPTAVGLMGGFASAGTGTYERMVQTSRDTIAIDPDLPAPYFSLAWGYISLGRPSDAEQALPQTSVRSPLAQLLPFHIAFLKADAPGMDRQAALARGKPGAEDGIAHLQALVLARAGRLDAARQSARHAIALATAAGQGERAAVQETAIAVWEAWYGNAAAARRGAMHVLEVANGRHVSYAAALALAMAGERSRAQTIADDLDSRFPEDTSVRFNYVPTLRALLALGANNPLRALEVLQPAATYEFAQPGISFYGAGGGAFGAMYPIYVRGAAYLALHKPTEAAAEFQKILDHPGIVLEDPMGAIARLQLGRALARTGDTAKAKAVYADLLALWKDADPDLELPKRAKAEFSALR